MRQQSLRLERLIIPSLSEMIMLTRKIDSYADMLELQAYTRQEASQRSVVASKLATNKAARQD